MFSLLLYFFPSASFFFFFFFFKYQFQACFVAWLSYRAYLVAQRVKHLPAKQVTWVRSLGQEDPMEKEMATHSSTLAWKIAFRLALLLDYPILPFIPRWFTESFLYLLGEYTYEKANHFLALSSSYLYSQCLTFYSYSLNNPTVIFPVYLVPIFLLLFFNYLQCILRILNIYGVPYIYLWCCNLLISWRVFVDYCARKRFRKLFSKLLFSLDKW